MNFTPCRFLNTIQKRVLPYFPIRVLNFLKGFRIKSGEGFTIAELLVVLSIFLIVIVTIHSVFLFSQRAYSEGQTRIEMLQNGRVILERISREVRQAREIVTDLPEEDIDSPREIVFQDGHLSLISATGTCQEISTTTVKLVSDSSDADDFYKDVFVKIIEGVGQGQIRKIVGYNGSSKIATLERDWDEPFPQASSVYKMDSYYYFRYFLEDDRVKKQIVAYYFPDDENTYMGWNYIDRYGNPPGGPDLCQFAHCSSCPDHCLILEERAVGEYVGDLKFWGGALINVFINLSKSSRNIEFSTKIFGRNL